MFAATETVRCGAMRNVGTDCRRSSYCASPTKRSQQHGENRILSCKSLCIGLHRISAAFASGRNRAVGHEHALEFLSDNLSALWIQSAAMCLEDAIHCSRRY